ncbi:MAG: formate--tetrahydrofolate ligase, partial [Elusimicrobiota bacterium]
MHKIGRRFYNEGFIWLVLAYIVALIVLDQRGYFLSKVNSISQRINQEAELVVKVEAPLEVKTNRIEFPVSTLISGRKTILLARCYNTTLKGVPKGWTLPIRDILIYSGAKFLCPMAGDITLMPGTGSDP